MEKNNNKMCISLIEGTRRDDMVTMRNRLFVPDPREKLWPFDRQESPFADGLWKCILVPEDFYDATFGDDDRYGLPLRRSGGWPQRNGMRDINTHMDPLIWCLEHRGCDSIVVTNDWESTHNTTVPSVYFRVALNLESISAACRACEQARPKDWPYRVLAFDTSGEWASCDYFDDDHLIGGTSEFIEQYHAAAGGEDFVRAWYYHWNLTNLLSGPNEHGSPESYYGHTGWPPPVYPEDSHYGCVLMGEDIDWTPMFGDRIKSCGPGVTPDEFEVIETKWLAAEKKRNQTEPSSVG